MVGNIKNFVVFNRILFWVLIIGEYMPVIFLYRSTFSLITFDYCII